MMSFKKGCESLCHWFLLAMVAKTLMADILEITQLNNFKLKLESINSSVDIYSLCLHGCLPGHCLLGLCIGSDWTFIIRQLANV